MLRCLSSQRSSSPDSDTRSNSNCRGHQNKEQVVQRTTKSKNLFCGKTKATNGAEMVANNGGDVASPATASSKGQQLTWEKLSPEEFLQLQDFAACKFLFLQ